MLKVHEQLRVSFVKFDKMVIDMYNQLDTLYPIGTKVVVEIPGEESIEGKVTNHSVCCTKGFQICVKHSKLNEKYYNYNYVYRSSDL